MRRLLLALCLLGGLLCPARAEHGVIGPGPGATPGGHLAPSPLSL